MTPLTERNRQNAQSSTGPKTDEGKAKSSRNSLAHGFYSKTALLHDESAEEYHAHTAAYMDDLKPQGPLQTDLAIIVSDNSWMLRRARKLLATQGQSTSEFLEAYTEEPDSIRHQICMKQARLLESFGRHAQRLQNAMLKALKDLKALQAEARKLQTQPAQTKTRSGFVPATEFSTAAGTAPHPGIAPIGSSTDLPHPEKAAA